jgi:hypothetical protein
VLYAVVRRVPAWPELPAAGLFKISRVLAHKGVIADTRSPPTGAAGEPQAETLATVHRVAGMGTHAPTRWSSPRIEPFNIFDWERVDVELLAARVTVAL